MRPVSTWCGGRCPSPTDSTTRPVPPRSGFPSVLPLRASRLRGTCPVDVLVVGLYGAEGRPRDPYALPVVRQAPHHARGRVLAGQPRGRGGARKGGRCRVPLRRHPDDLSGQARHARAREGPRGLGVLLGAGVPGPAQATVRPPRRPTPLPQSPRAGARKAPGAPRPPARPDASTP